MGLIKAAIQSVSSTLSDQYLEFFTCDSLGKEILVKRGAKRMSKGSNKGDMEVISNGSKIAVPEGTALLLVDNGKVTDFTTEAGMYTWDASSAPTCFGASGFLEGAKQSIGDLWNRIKSGGEIPMQQRVYFVNMLEIIDNKFGTPSPIPYDDPTYLGIYIRVNGSFSFRIENPVAFFTSVVGNVTESYTRDMLMDQAKMEFISKLSEALSRMGSGGDNIQYNRLQREQTTLRNYMNDVLDEEWLEGRGMIVVSVGIGGITPDDESRVRIQDFDRDIMLGKNPEMLAARAVAMNAEAQVAAANNKSGALGALMGVGVLGGMGAGGMGGTPASAAFDVIKSQQVAHAASTPVAAAVATSGWKCECGHEGNSGKFCAECGKPMPKASQGWDCVCGAKANTGKFCSECGKKKEAEVAVAECKACGWKGAEGQAAPKFCPECGQPIK
jgi:membrane protease subunit (stomatin/prohibitin family)